MGAREKINGGYFLGIGVIAGFLGLATGSVIVFLVCFGLLAAVTRYDGGIRLTPSRR